jgi:hypothetical protein
MTYKNIEFDSSILESDKKEAHSHNLNVVSKNISEFNRRNPEDRDIRYKYHKRKIGHFEKESFGFDRINETGYSHYSDSYLTPNCFVYISRNTEEFEMWVDLFCDRVYNSFMHYKNLYGSAEIDLFVKLFKDFFPQGDFLSSEQIETFKKKINKKCRLAESYKE